MSTPSTTENELCTLCSCSRQKAKLLPCLHDEICYVCTRRLCSGHSECPICRSEILGVQSVRGRQTVDEIRTTYLSDERQDLRKTKQITLIGYSFQTNNSIIEAIVTHSEKNFENEIDQTRFSPNCLYAKRECKITERTYSYEQDTLINRERFSAHLIAAVVPEVSENTIQRFLQLDGTAKTLSEAPIVWLLEQDGNILVCRGVQKARLMRKAQVRDIGTEFVQEFTAVITATPNRAYSQEQARNLYGFLWKEARRSHMEKAKMFVLGFTCRARLGCFQ